MFSTITKPLKYFSIGLRQSLPLFKEKKPVFGGPTTQRKGNGTNVIGTNMLRGIDHIKDPRLNKSSNEHVRVTRAETSAPERVYALMNNIKECTAVRELYPPPAPRGPRTIALSRRVRWTTGLAFTLKERQALGIHGLLACSFRTQEEQLEICRISIDRYQNNLNKYLYLAELYDTNERLFYSLLSQDIEKYLPLIYTPTVGLACQKFGLAYRKPRGLFITILDRGNVLSILNNWPEPNVRAICFTDGERILGLGDLGAFGMGIPIGKLALYTVLAGVKPDQCLPITLDVGTNNEALLSDPLYIGLRQKRVRGKEYDDFLDEFMKACVIKYGSNTLLQFEDFALLNATPLLQRYRDNYCTFNDDIQGTASVAVAGLITAQRITKKKMSDNIFMFLGAGSAAAGIGNLCVDAMKEEGLSEKDAQGRIYMVDIDGLLTTKRESGVPDHAKQFGKELPAEKNFEKLVANVKPTVLIGASTVGGAFTPAILKQMAQNAERPIIFALSNPTPKAECTAQAAFDNTEGRCVFASGSPFPPVNYNGKTYLTGQGNNAYIFPGVALGVICCAAHSIPEKFFLRAAQSLANFVSESDLDLGRIYPPLTDIKKVSIDIAVDIAKLAYELEIATHFPRPKDLKSFIMAHMYDLQYPSSLPNFYDINVPTVPLKSIDEVYPGEVGTGTVKGKPPAKL